ncbi:GTPase Era [Megasphaera vaginalis (ex Bordigoni et al. 2020)]|uniref:GTPase Era n=1 Tax=Megasphaera vaginalis (ex Bordigoni et al. 2020) TaxID=2045301 RepID=UPI000C7A4101|nr:GTPase Era [Megasphaera vaginalis (ex Bordigoni et al. 2020)]
MNESFKSGFVAVVGRPNVGKSTLINRIIKQKVSIVSDKAQTTRNRILCVHTDDACQIVFLDTPGIHKPRHKLGKFMDEMAYQSLQDIDAVLFLVAGNEKRGPGDLFVLDKIAAAGVPVFLLINKIDKLSKGDILKEITDYANLYDFAQIIPISALQGDNVDTVVAELCKLLPSGPKYFPDDMMTDQPERLLVAEIVREKLLLATRDEVPHAIAVYVDEMKERGGKIYIRMTVFVERESQKRIVIGKNGAVLKEVGRLARSEIEHLLGNTVYLDIWVKVRSDWRNQASALSEFGYKNE